MTHQEPRLSTSWRLGTELHTCNLKPSRIDDVAHGYVSAAASTSQGEHEQQAAGAFGSQARGRRVVGMRSRVRHPTLAVAGALWQPGTRRHRLEVGRHGAGTAAAHVLCDRGHQAPGHRLDRGEPGEKLPVPQLLHARTPAQTRGRGRGGAGGLILPPTLQATASTASCAACCRVGSAACCAVCAVALCGAHLVGGHV